MLILAQYERNEWSPTGRHVMCEHSHELIVIQCEKQLQDFDANGCLVACSVPGVQLCCGHAALLWR